MIQIHVASWETYKTMIASKSLRIQYAEYPSYYEIYANEEMFIWQTSIKKDGGADVTDFETNVKPTANQPVMPNVSVEKVAPFGAKTMTIGGVTKKLYARNTGIQVALTQGANQIDFTISYPWVKILGVEVINAEVLDYTDLKVLDAASNPYFGTPSAVLNQFAYSNNIGKDFYVRVAQFDADIYQNMVIRLNYTSVSAKTVGFNFVMFEVKS